MTDISARGFLDKKYGAENVKYLGSGSDSDAFLVGDKVFRFTQRNAAVYQREADICKFLAPFITYEIPKITVREHHGLFYAQHKIISGDKWSWHKFSWRPAAQRNLARTLAQFMAQLHGVNTTQIISAVPSINSAIPYIEFDRISPVLERFMGPRTLRCFRRNYERIISKPVPERDMVVVHMGIKGANSVCYSDGRIKGVFDFGNCGIYERGRVFAGAQWSAVS